MKKTSTYLLLSVLILFALTTNAQQTDTLKNNTETPGENLVKINLTALPLKNFSFQYERAISKKISAVIGLRFMKKGGLPLKSLFKDAIDDDELWNDINLVKTGNFAITPEVRFYMGQGVFRGFYLAPFVRYAKYTANLPFEYEYDHPVTGSIKEKIILDGKINTFTGGLLIGAQWKLSKLVYLDWWILGPHYGTSKGDIAGNKNLSPEEQEALRDQLKDFEDLPLVNTTSTVNDKGATVHFKGPWAGVRAGINLGFRF